MIKNISILLIFICATTVFAAKKEFKRNPFEKFTSRNNDRLSSKDLFKNIKKGGLIIKLKGVIWDIAAPQAVIEIQQISKTVKIGDTLGPVYIADITQKELILKVDNKTYILDLGKEFRI